MKCIVFSLLLAVALALPAPYPDDDSSSSSQQSQQPDSRRSFLSSSSDREDDDDNSTYEKSSRSGSDREDDDDDDEESDSRSRSRSNSDREDDDENSTYESRSDSSSSAKRSYKSSERVNELSAYLDFLNDKYDGRGTLKVEYSPSPKKYERYSGTHNLGSLHFTYQAPGKSYRSKNYKNYYVYSPMGLSNPHSYKSKPQPYSSMDSGESASDEDQPYYKSKDVYKPHKYYKSRGYKKSLYSKSNSQDDLDDDDSNSN